MLCLRYVEIGDTIVDEQERYELEYLRAFIQWVDDHALYEPLDIEQVIKDYKESIQHGKPSAVSGSWSSAFVPPRKAE